MPGEGGGGVSVVSDGGSGGESFGGPAGGPVGESVGGSAREPVGESVGGSARESPGEPDGESAGEPAAGASETVVSGSECPPAPGGCEALLPAPEGDASFERLSFGDTCSLPPCGADISGGDETRAHDASIRAAHNSMQHLFINFIPTVLWSPARPVVKHAAASWYRADIRRITGWPVLAVDRPARVAPGFYGVNAASGYGHPAVFGEAALI